MRTYALLSTQKKTRLLSRLLKKAGEPVKIRAIASELGVAPSFVSNYVKLLRAEKIVAGNQIEVSAPQTRLLKSFLNISTVIAALPHIKKLIPYAGIGVYGSWHSGTNTETSDLDLWISVEQAPQINIQAKISKTIRETADAEPSIMYLTKKSLSELKAKDLVFYLSLKNSFLLDGDPLD